MFSPSKLKRARELKLILEAVFAEIDNDLELRALMGPPGECVKCGSGTYKEAIDEDKNGYVWCCSDCPDEEEYDA